MSGRNAAARPGTRAVVLPVFRVVAHPIVCRACTTNSRLAQCAYATHLGKHKFISALLPIQRLSQCPARPPHVFEERPVRPLADTRNQEARRNHAVTEQQRRGIRIAQVRGPDQPVHVAEPIVNRLGPERRSAVLRRQAADQRLAGAVTWPAYCAKPLIGFSNVVCFFSIASRSAEVVAGTNCAGRALVVRSINNDLRARSTDSSGAQLGSRADSSRKWAPRTRRAYATCPRRPLVRQ